MKPYHTDRGQGLSIFPPGPGTAPGTGGKEGGSAMNTGNSDVLSTAEGIVQAGLAAVQTVFDEPNHQGHQEHNEKEFCHHSSPITQLKGDLNSVFF
ncbi:hypothetical protein [Pararhodospirillum oryzae]|nr:hypothetical protein [Pararhodospirillum oryzae]